MKILRNLKNFFRDNKRYYILGIILLIVIDSIQLLMPQILRSATNLLQDELLTMRGLIIHSLLIITIGLVMALGRYFWRVYLYGSSRRLEYYLRNKLFNHLLTLSPNFYNTNKTGDIMAHATNDINAIRATFGQGIMMVIDAVFLTILTIIIMIRTTSLKFTALSLMTLPLISIIGRRFSQIIHRRSRGVQESFSNLSNQTQESFSGIRVIKSFVQEDLVIDNFLEVNQENLEKNLSLVKVSGLFSPLTQLISSISFFIVILYGGRLVIYEQMSLGDFIAFTNYLSILIWPMMAVGWVINIVQRGLASLDRINEILDVPADILDKPNSQFLPSIEGAIEFRNVNFTYKNAGTKALSNINFQVQPGESLAIIGPTGSGKSSLVKLLLRIYDDYEGEIFIDGTNIRDIKLKSLRGHISYVAQDNFLFSRTIKENIAFSREDQPTDREIIEAAKFSQVYKNIIDFPLGFDTILGERGVTLSGGQKQRVSISRAIIKDSRILIFDDSFSSVDTDTEEKILANIESLDWQPTTIIISHRISTIKNADQILVLDDGKIIQAGNHSSLLKDKEGLYNYLYERQLLEEKVAQTSSSKDGGING